MFTNILVGYDGSGYSARALGYAQDLALKYHAQIVIAYAFYPLPNALLGSPYSEKIQAHAIMAGEAIVTEARAKLAGTPITLATELLEGPPAEALLRVAETRGCDLIILGSRGMGTLKASLLGSVSDKVLHNATIPVLIVK